jgi:hypothetical protein
MTMTCHASGLSPTGLCTVRHACGLRIAGSRTVRAAAGHTPSIGRRAAFPEYGQDLVVAEHLGQFAAGLQRAEQYPWVGGQPAPFVREPGKRPR